jgi:hypothetical protein
MSMFKSLPAWSRRAGAVRSRATVAVVALVFGAGIGAAGAAYAAIPDPGGEIHGCVGKLTGTLRIIDPSTGAQCDALLETPLGFSQRGPQGATGATGATGAAGATGATGAQGPAGVSGYQVVTFTGPSTDVDDSESATCPAGKQAISGGGYVVDDTGGISGIADAVAIRASLPLSLHSTDDSWDVRVFETVTDNEVDKWHLVVFAVCATIGS